MMKNQVEIRQICKLCSGLVETKGSLSFSEIRSFYPQNHIISDYMKQYIHIEGEHDNLKDCILYLKQCNEDLQQKLSYQELRTR